MTPPTPAPSKAPTRTLGFFLGPALKTLGTVIARAGVQVALSGSDEAAAPLRLDSPPTKSRDGGCFWLTAALMPSYRLEEAW